MSSAEPELVTHDSRPPEYDLSTLEADLDVAAALGGLADFGEVADAEDRVAAGDEEVVRRTRAWLAANPTAVRS